MFVIRFLGSMKLFQIHIESIVELTADELLNFLIVYLEFRGKFLQNFDAMFLLLFLPRVFFLS